MTDQTEELNSEERSNLKAALGALGDSAMPVPSFSHITNSEDPPAADIDTRPDEQRFSSWWLGGAIAAVAAGLLLFAAVSWTNNASDSDRDGVVTSTPAEERTPSEPRDLAVAISDATTVVALGTSSKPYGDLAVARDVEEYDRLLSGMNLPDEPEPVDLDDQIMVAITLPGGVGGPLGDCLETGFAQFTETEPGVLAPQFEQTVPNDPSAGCPVPLVTWTTLLAIDRAAIGDGFTLRTPDEDAFKFEEKRIWISSQDLATRISDATTVVVGGESDEPLDLLRVLAGESLLDDIDPSTEVQDPNWEENVIVSMTVTGARCYREFAEFTEDEPGVLTPRFAEPTRECEDELTIWTTVLAIDRDAIGNGFTLRLPGDEGGIDIRDDSVPEEAALPAPSVDGATLIDGVEVILPPGNDMVETGQLAVTFNTLVSQVGENAPRVCPGVGPADAMFPPSCDDRGWAIGDFEFGPDAETTGTPQAERTHEYRTVRVVWPPVDGRVRYIDDQVDVPQIDPSVATPDSCTTVDDRPQVVASYGQRLELFDLFTFGGVWFSGRNNRMVLQVTDAIDPHVERLEGSRVMDPCVIQVRHTEKEQMAAGAQARQLEQHGEPLVESSRAGAYGRIDLYVPVIDEPTMAAIAEAVDQPTAIRIRSVALRVQPIVEPDRSTSDRPTAEEPGDVRLLDDGAVNVRLGGFCSNVDWGFAPTGEWQFSETPPPPGPYYDESLEIVRGSWTGVNGETVDLVVPAQRVQGAMVDEAPNLPGRIFDLGDQLAYSRQSDDPEDAGLACNYGFRSSTMSADTLRNFVEGVTAFGDA